jgi:hypothetical protein
MWVCTEWRESQVNPNDKNRLWACITAERGSGWWEGYIFVIENDIDGEVSLENWFDDAHIKLRTSIQHKDTFVHLGCVNYFIREPTQEVRNFHRAYVERIRFREQQLCPVCLIGQRELFRDACILCEP